jgi:toxin ParE1/3/4
MGSYKLSTEATKDITGIYIFSIRNFGFNQAKKYVTELEAFFIELSEKEELARDASLFAYNLKLYDFKSHVIFYLREEKDTILVVSVLGKYMTEFATQT